MPRIRQQEITVFSSGLALLYSASDMNSLSGRITRCLHHMFDCDLVSFDLVDLSAVRWNTLIISPTVPHWGAALEALQQHAHEHPIVAHATRYNDSHAIRTSDILSVRQYRQLGIYHDFFRPYIMQLDRQLGFVAKPGESLTFGVSVNRKGRDFTGEQRNLLEFLRPHVLQAYLTAQAHSRLLDSQIGQREGAGAAAGGGLCEIDATGRLAWTTAAVEDLLARHFPSGQSGAGYLPAPLLGLLREALSRPRKSQGEKLAARRSWQVRSQRGTLQMHLAANPTPGSWQILLEERREDPSPAELSAGHGLTGREGETLYWIGQGKTNEEIGLILGISNRTAEKYVERLLEKLAVYNRTAAARVAMGK